CPSNLVHPSFTTTPTTALANTDILFEGSVTVDAPLNLAYKFRDEPNDDGDDDYDNDQDNGADQFDWSSLFSNNVFPIAWEWDFGDGTKGFGRVVTHQYTADGCYTVTLTVVMSNFMCGTASITDVV